MTIGPGNAIFDTNGHDATLGGAITGGSASTELHKIGAGTLTLTGNNTYTGQLQINAGTLILTGDNQPSFTSTPITSGATLQIGNGGTTGSLTGNVTNDGLFIINRSNAYTFDGVISGAGSFVQMGTGTTTLTATNTYSGGTTISAGKLAVSADANLGVASGGLSFGGGTLQYLAGFTSNRGVTLNAGGGTFDTNGNSASIAGVISGSGDLTKIGTGMLTLSGANTYSGATTIAAGTLAAQNATALGTTAAGTTVIAGATLEIADGVAIGAETLNLSGAGVGSNGALVVTSGAASFGGAITLGANAGTGGNGSLTLGGTVNDTSAGTSTLTQVGSGTLTFSNTVGATNALAAVTTSAGQTTAVNGGSVTTTGAQAYGGSVTTSGATALTSTGGGNITANNTANNFGGDLMLSTSGAASIVSSTALTLGASSVGTLTAQTLAGNLTQSGALTVGGTSSFATLASNASITLANTGNQLTGAVSLNTSGANGNASLTNASATVLGASTLGGNLTVQTNSISVSGPINASGQTVTLAPLTASTAMTLGASGGLALTQTDLNNITASTLVLGSPGSTGGITVGGPVTLATTGLTNLSLITTGGITVSNPITVTNGANATLTLNTTGTATQSAAITASNLALLGSGGSYTLNHSGNLIGTVAANTGSVNLTSNGAVTIGAVGGVTGWTTTGNSRLTASGGTSDITVSNAVNWSNSSLTLVAGRNITINANMTGGPAGDLTALANGNLTIGAAGLISGKTIALSATGAFTNNRGSDAVSASDRWLVYSSAPDAPGQNFGNLNSNNTAIWNSTYATLPPPLVTYPGNRYIFAFAAGTTPATLTVTSLNDSKTYGDTASLSLFTVSGFQAGVANAYLADPNVYSGTPGLFSAGATAIANAGIYPIIASQGTLAASGNYSFAFNNTGLLTVNPKALTITANDATQTYDGVAFSGGNGVTYNGFVNGQNASVLSGTIAYVGNSQGAANAGTYTIIPSNQTSSNYAINYVNATLTINPQPLTITANNVTQTFNTVPYSGANGVIYSGFVNGQNSSVLSGSIIYGGNSQGAVNVGTYAIIPSGQTSSNYAITYVNGTLTITPPPIAFVLDALGTTANAAGTTAPSTVMNATILPSPTSFPGSVTFGSNTVLPYGNDAGTTGGSKNQQTSDVSVDLKGRRLIVRTR